MRRIFAFLIIFLYFSTASASIFSKEDIGILKENLFANFTPQGAIMASPSTVMPNYYYDWVRDSAITMSLVETWYEQTQELEYKQRLIQYVLWTKRLQNQIDLDPDQDILGEPKFYMPADKNAGHAFEGPWGRPQNDGPAIRASALIHFAEVLLKQGEENYVRSELYNNSLDPMTMGVIKKDLEYVANHWQEKNYDLWEEVYGYHFFTTMVQRKALLEGAELARHLNDTGAAEFYQAKASEMVQRLMEHIDHKNNTIQASLLPHPGPQKTQELDSAVILGVILGENEEAVFTVDNLYVKNTVAALKRQFKNYPINASCNQAILFGRYPGDTYDGYQNDGYGNPWYILTATMAEYYYHLAEKAANKHQGKLFNIYLHQGDDYLQLIKEFAPDLYISEQINLETGIPQGAHSLTWSYVAVMRAINLREKLN